ncbi:ATP-binding protein [Spirochaeta isovalerica]|uniref:histidine kinase n=1 Tax=Spirochaeta isovalerica TaxID=150 RepID=A0A841RAF7_9SPIO|nr:ATP-binding protein [Spirochaeta isovalerica]MBB6479422.1 signal transduction histidine kinase [Spirochaeta isovalerica]
MREKTLVPKYPFLIYILLMVSVYLLICFLYRSNQDVVLEQMNADTEYNSIVLANDISKILEKSEMILDLLEQEIQLMRDKSEMDVSAIIKDFRLKYLNIYDLYIFDKDGLNYSSRTENPLLEESLGNIFNLHKDNLIRSNITADSKNTSSFLISRAVFDSLDQVQNVFVCSVNIEEILSFDEIMSMYNFSQIAILDQNYNILFSAIDNDQTAGGNFENSEDNINLSTYKIMGYPFFIALETDYRNTFESVRRQYFLYILVVSVLLIFGLFLVRYLVQQNRKQAILEDKLAQQGKLEAIGRVTGGVAHQFNNIHSAIMGASELIKTAKDDDAKDRYLDIIRTSLKKASGIIDDLLSYSRNNFMLEKSKINIRDVLKVSAESVKGYSGKKVDIQILSNQKIELFGDINLLSDAFSNLIDNAVQSFDKSGTVKINYTILPGAEIEYLDEASDESINYVEINVEDNGTGIAEEDLDKIFDPFFSTKAQGKGIGLGLSSVYGIVREHDGSIHAESRTNEGTVIKIALPLL